MTANLRNYRAGDLDELVEIERQALPNAWSRELLERWIRRPDADCRVLELDGSIAGFVLVVYQPDGMHLANLAVRTEHRRTGLALEALAAVDEIAVERGAAHVSLEVRETNLAAQKLYRAAGYRAVEIAKGYYGEEDAYRMVKRFGARR